MEDSNPYWMERALELAQAAAAQGEVPVGAIVVADHEMTAAGIYQPMRGVSGDLVAEAANLKETSNVATHHAEILAIERACQKLGRWRLSDCTLFVTLEPCLMCAGAIVQARLARVIYGACDPKAGAFESAFKVLQGSGVNHRPQLVSGVRSKECSTLLSRFFSQRRRQDKLGE